MNGYEGLMAVQQMHLSEQQEIQMIRQMAQAQPTVAQMLGQQNYRPPVTVPQGWADWFDCADEMQ